MTLTIRLERRMAVVAWHVVGTIAFAVRRDWEPAVAALAAERGEIGATDVAEVLLNGQAPAARRLLAVAAQLGLLAVTAEDTYEVTEAGRAAAEAGDVLVPEAGTWTIWLAEDPLLSTPLVRVEPFAEPTAYDEDQARRRDEPRREMRALPPALTDLVGHVVSPGAGDGRVLRIDDLGRQRVGEVVTSESAMKLVLSLGSDTARLGLVGEIDGRRIDSELPAPALRGSEAWRVLLRGAGLLDRWNEQRAALEVGFDETADAERETLRRSVHLPAPALPGLGVFEATDVAAVALRPRTAKDATAWATSRLIARVQAYATPTKYAAWCAEAAAPFEDFAFSLPAMAELARAVAPASGSQVRTATSWRLQVPIDWSLGGER